MLLKTYVLLLAIVPSSAVPFRRVVNGVDITNDDPRPWTVWLRKGLQRLHCGGTLISDTWVLTAASCLNNQINAVVAGCDDRTLPRGTEQYSEIAETIVHPNFNATTLENDIGLIRVATPFLLNNKVQPLSYLTEDVLDGVDIDQIYGKQCRIAGWGQPTFMRKTEFANPLKEVVTQRVDDFICSRKFENRPSSMICFEPYRRPELSSTCDGDQGGPFICKVRMEWYLVGVISSWNTDVICSNGIKGATAVSEYVEWIQSTLASDAVTSNPFLEPIVEPNPEEQLPVEETPEEQTFQKPAPVDEPTPGEHLFGKPALIPEPTPDELAPEEPTPEEPLPEEPTPVDPAQEEPAPEDPTTEEPTTDEPTPADPTPEEPTPEEPSPEEPTPEEPTPDEPTPEEPTPEDPTPEEPTPEEPTPEQPTPEDPTPEEPTPEDPTPEEPTPVEPTPDEPAPEEPTPEEPTPEAPTPEEPSPEEPGTEEPTPEPTTEEPSSTVQTTEEPTPEEPTSVEPSPGERISEERRPKKPPGKPSNIDQEPTTTTPRIFVQTT